MSQCNSPDNLESSFTEEVCSNCNHHATNHYVENINELSNEIRIKPKFKCRFCDCRNLSV